MSQKEVKEGLYYSSKHEWIFEKERGLFLLGISDYAQHALGDIVYLDIPMKQGDLIEKGDSLAVIESVKAVAEVYAPIAGRIFQANEALLQDALELNTRPYEAWILQIQNNDLEDNAFASLMDAAAYQKYIAEL